VDYLSIFAAAFVSATLFPTASEILLLKMAMAGHSDILFLLIFASFGNILGSVVNWALGFFFSQLANKRWFPMRASSLAIASNWFNKFGIWTLIFSWVPFVGDPLTFLAGVLRVNFFKFIILVSIGKIFRYVLVLKLFID
jgi:membrane protein YqaA with SNARE-associated domain